MLTIWSTIGPIFDVFFFSVFCPRLNDCHRALSPPRCPSEEMTGDELGRRNSLWPGNFSALTRSARFKRGDQQVLLALMGELYCSVLLSPRMAQAGIISVSLVDSTTVLSRRTTSRGCRQHEGPSPGRKAQTAGGQADHKPVLPLE